MLDTVSRFSPNDKKALKKVNCLRKRGQNSVGRRIKEAHYFLQLLLEFSLACPCVSFTPRFLAFSLKTCDVLKLPISTNTVNKKWFKEVISLRTFIIASQYCVQSRANF